MTRLKRIQAIDDNFLPPPGRFLEFYDLLDVVAKMFMIPRRKLDQSYSLSDYRMAQLSDRMGDLMRFYRSQLSRRVDRFPSVYKLDIQRTIIKPRCHCLDISRTHFVQDDMALWKCNGCRRYLAFLPKDVRQPMIAYKML